MSSDFWSSVIVLVPRPYLHAARIVNAHLSAVS